MDMESVILRNLISNDVYTRKVLPFIKSEYFSDSSDKLLFEITENFIHDYNSLPSVEALVILLNKTNCTEDQFKSTIEKLESFQSEENTENNLEWLLDNTEKFCQEKSIYNAVYESIQILDGNNKSLDKGAIPKLLSDALAVGFDTNVGHNYTENADDRYEYYHRVENKIPFNIATLDRVTKGGIAKKTLNLIIAGINVGKTLAMCHLAATYMSQGKNVLYITLEMAEEEIAKRIDANLLNVSMDDLMKLPKDLFDKKVEKVRSMTTGKLFIKEFPTATASVNNFRSLLNELNLKQNFVADIVIVDYLNLATSARVKLGSLSGGSYGYVKAIAEEFRGLAVEYNVGMWSATQFTRGGMSSSDPDMDDTSESIALPATVDFMMAMISDEELESMNQIMVKQLKSRYGNKSDYPRFTIGVDKSKMRLFDDGQSPNTEKFIPNNTNESKKNFSSFKV